MTEIVRGAAMGVTALAAIVIAVGILRALTDREHVGSRVAAALAFGLELLLAAGLLRLSTAPDLAALGLVGLLIAVRRLLSFGVGRSVRTLEG